MNKYNIPEGIWNRIKDSYTKEGLEYIQKLSEKQNKYKNKKMFIDMIEFDSIKEANRYCELKILEKAGKISKLELQPPFKYYEGDKYIFTYKADFQYIQNGITIIEDVKSAGTAKIAVYRLKKKLIEAKFKVKITEVM